MSRRISGLEEHLRTKLLIRTGRWLKLTDAGRPHVAACRDILAAMTGLGITRVLSYQIEPALRNGALQAILAEFASEPAPVNLIDSGQGLLPLKTRAFIDFATGPLRSQLKT